MYLQTLIPSGRPIAVLLATTSVDELLRLRLARQGWVSFGRALQPGAAGQVRFGVERVQLRAEGRLVLDAATSPVSPDGWWAAVDNLGGHCVVVLAREGAVDLTPGDGDPLASLLNTDQAVSAALPVVLAPGG